MGTVRKNTNGLIRMVDGRWRAAEVSVFATSLAKAPGMSRSALERDLALLAKAKRRKTSPRALANDRVLQTLIADLVAARVAVRMSQREVAELMWTTKSVVSRLENGRYTRPTLSTIEYAVAVGARVEIRVRPMR